MKYGKLVDGQLKLYNGHSVRVNGRVYNNPSAETLFKFGYKPIVEDPCPEEREGYYLVSYYVDEPDCIRFAWRYEEIPPEEEFVDEEPDGPTGDTNG